MTAFVYRDGALHAEDVPLARIAAEVGTPTYVYSSAAILGEWRGFRDAFAGMDATVCYAMKANDSLAVLRMLAREGAGCDVVSEGELRLALAAGMPAARIVFAGVGKTEGEMAAALEAGIMQFNVESPAELDMLDTVARRLGRRAPVALRVNPDVDAGTLDKISTGRKTDKFGIAWEAAPDLFRRAAALPGIAIEGIAVHIGSQLISLGPFRTAFARVRELAAGLLAEGIPLRRLDLGGGIGVTYRDETPPTPGDYAAIVRETVGDLGLALVVEPGRRLVARAGVLLTRVVLTKDAGGRRFTVVDAAMNDLIRPALYDAWHPIRPLREPDRKTATITTDIVGPVCESTDVLGTARDLPPLAAGDLLAIEAAGAYGAVMASEYNGRRRAAEVLVDGGRWAVVRPRPSYEDMIAQHRLPPWLE